jgi:hypothetical protein
MQAAGIRRGGVGGVRHPATMPTAHRPAQEEHVPAATTFLHVFQKHPFDTARSFANDPRFLRTRPERSRAGDPLEGLENQGLTG